MNTSTIETDYAWRISLQSWVIITISLLITAFIFQDAISDLLMNWEREEYSHGYLIPVISLFLVWQQKDRLEIMQFDNFWPGILFLCLGILLFAAGTIGAVIDIVSYGLVIVILALVSTFTGLRGFKLVFMPLVILFFMIPLPSFLYAGLSSELQLISSQIGVSIIRLFDISVFLEGNVIDLGVYKLQVVEACSGLRYLFPLVTLSYIAAYFYKVEFWKRAVLFLSAIPITVLMNSIRIGLIGVSVEYWGIEMAEGILHDFEGWVVFMGCIIVLVAEMYLLLKIGKTNKSLADAFGLEIPNKTPDTYTLKQRPIPKSYLSAFAILLLTSIAVLMTPERVDVVPERNTFNGFPLELGDWQAKKQIMEQIYVDALRFDDYILADYKNMNSNSSINLYAAYYNVQRTTKVPHSPKQCIPGGGWEINSLTQHQVKGVSVGGVPLNVNRLVIQKDEYKQLVYYWFQQRGRVLTSEYDVKWKLLLDSINTNRTDGALMRLTIALTPGQNLADADEQLTAFSKLIVPYLPEYIPGQ